MIVRERYMRQIRDFMDKPVVKIIFISQFSVIIFKSLGTTFFILLSEAETISQDFMTSHKAIP